MAPKVRRFARPLGPEGCAEPRGRALIRSIQLAYAGYTDRMIIVGVGQVPEKGDMHERGEARA